MTSWPKDKVPKRNSQGDRWREHQLVRFVSFIFFLVLKKKNLAPFKMTLDLSSSIIKHFYKFYFFSFSFIAGVPAAQAGLGVSLLPLRRAAESHFLSGFRGRPQWYNNPPGKKKRFNLGSFSWMDYLNVFLFYYPRHCARHRLRQRNQHSCPGLWSFHLKKKCIFPQLSLLVTILSSVKATRVAVIFE